jgi:putative membrane protein
MVDATDTPERDDREALQAVATQRLHPLSWLFTLIAQLRMFALPLLVLLLGGSRKDGDDIGDLIGLAGAGVLAVVAVWQYFTYRYGFLESALVIRSGLLQRNVRLIPFDRVQNVTLHQNLLHRLVGVAEVRLESAGGMGNAEAQMQVLKLEQANALEALVREGANRARAAQATDAGGDATRDDAPVLWLALPTRELVRLGLISNRGMLVVAAGFAYLTQAGDVFTKRLSNGIESMGREGIALAEAWHLGPVAYAGLAFALLVAMVAAVRLLSVALAILQFHDFRLHAGERELRVERGLISRVRSHLPKRRIQAYSLRETLLHRWFGRQSLRVDRASVEAVNESQSVRDLVPLAAPAGMDGMLAALLPEGSWPLQDWQTAASARLVARVRSARDGRARRHRAARLLRGPGGPVGLGAARSRLPARAGLGPLFGMDARRRRGRVPPGLARSPLALRRSAQAARVADHPVALRSPPRHGHAAPRHGGRFADGTGAAHPLPRRRRGRGAGRPPARTDAARRGNQSRQNWGVSSTSSVNTSRRPSTIAKLHTHTAKSLMSRKWDATAPRPGTHVVHAGGDRRERGDDVDAIRRERQRHH